MTPQQLAAAIAQRLAGRYVRNPQVTVNMVEAVEPGASPSTARS